MARHKMPSFKVDMNSMSASVTPSRFAKQYDQAQYLLDGQVMTDMVPLMPMQTGTFIRLTRTRSAAIQGTGEVVAAAPPYGRFLYAGKVMVDEVTGSAWARPGARKVVTPKDLAYDRSTNTEAQAMWFEEAKRRHLKRWLELAGRTAGGGKK